MKPGTILQCGPRFVILSIYDNNQTLFHRRTRASYVYNGCLAWYKFVYITYTTLDSGITYTRIRFFRASLYRFLFSSASFFLFSSLWYTIRFRAHYEYFISFNSFTPGCPLNRALLGPFHGAIAVPSVTRCRRCCCCCGHRFYIAIHQVSLLSYAACAIAIAGFDSSCLGSGVDSSDPW